MILVFISLGPYYVVVQTQKCNGEIWFEKKQKNICLCYQNTAWILLRFRDQVLVNQSFLKIVPWDISFVPYPHETIFRS